MGTNFLKATLNTYAISKTVEGVGGYNYYMYIHPSGQVVIMRENSIGTEYKYANGGDNADVAWTNKTTLTYVDYDKLS